MGYTVLPENLEERRRRLGAMLREMVVEEALESLGDNRDVRNFTRDEIGDFIGCSRDTVRRIEEEALRKVGKNLIS